MSFTDTLDGIVRYESGRLDDDDTVDLFAALVRNGAAWSLQGSYGRTAYALMREGFIDSDGAVTRYPSEDPGEAD